MHRRIFTILFALLCLLSHPFAYGQDIPQSVKLAQFDGDDTYDPFADYSEFDQAQEEEEDINFFRNGRFISLGMMLGYRGWTQNLSKLMSGNLAYGIFFDYFFNLRFALEFSFVNSNHRFGVADPNTGATVGGDVNIQDFGFDLKFYVNTQNVTKGLAKFNPYALFGLSYLFRTTSAPSTSVYGKDGAMGFDLGGGIEWPLMKNKMFWGLQAKYTVVNFPGANSPLLVNPGVSTGITPNGDTYSLPGKLGINF